jgi:predicted nucleic acid-binding protein
MNSLVCVDASIIIWTLLYYPMSDRAEALLAKWRKEQTTLIAPSLFAFEVTSSLRRLVHLGEITPEEGEEAFEKFQRIEVRLSHRKGIFHLAWELAKRFNRPRAYDTAYLAYAQLNNCEFWTADEKLYNAVKDELDWVRWIGDYSPHGNGNVG